MTEYTTPIADGMRFRHDAQARITVTTGRQVLEDDLTPIGMIGGAMTRISFTYNQGSMSGRVSWWNPSTGKPIARPKVQIRVRPEDVLTGDELCPCPKCIYEEQVA